MYGPGVRGQTSGWRFVTVAQGLLTCGLIALLGSSCVRGEGSAERRALAEFARAAVGVERRGPQLVLIEIGAHWCRACADFGRYALPIIREEYVRRGLLRYRYVELPGGELQDSVAFLHRCGAEALGRFIARDRLHLENREVGGGTVAAVGEALGMAGERAVTRCIQRQKTAGWRAEQVEQLQGIGITVTPTFVLGLLREDGDLEHVRVFAGLLPMRMWRSELETALQ